MVGLCHCQNFGPWLAAASPSVALVDVVAGITTLSTQLWSYLILSDTHTTFYSQWHIFRVRCLASHRAVENLLVFGAALVLPLARVPLLKLQERGATTVLPSYACHLAHLSTKISTAKAAPVQQSQFGTAAS